MSWHEKQKRIPKPLIRLAEGYFDLAQHNNGEAKNEKANSATTRDTPQKTATGRP